MTLLQSVLLGLLQGLTEFIPVSSTGHLVLAEHLFNVNYNPKEMLSYDIVLHAGSLLALLIYFSTTWKKLIIAVFTYVSPHRNQEDKNLLNTLILATIPAIIVAVIFDDYIETYFRNPLIVTSLMGLTGIVFLFAERYPKEKTKDKVSIKEGIAIGVIQAIALLPGVSRSGTTMSAGMFNGVKRHVSAEFSFLLGTVAIFAATAYTSLGLFDSKFSIPLPFLIVGFITSFLSSLATIHFLLKFLKKYSLRIFSLYLVLISLLGFFLFYR